MSVGTRPIRQLFLSKIFPFIVEKTELVVYRITREEGSSEWSALKPSNRWNRYIILTLSALLVLEPVGLCLLKLMSRSRLQVSLNL